MTDIKLTPVHLALILPARPILTEGHQEGLRKALLHHLFIRAQLHPYVYAEKLMVTNGSHRTVAGYALDRCHDTGFFYAEETYRPTRLGSLKAILEKGSHGAIILTDGVCLPTIGNTLVRGKEKLVITVNPEGVLKTYNHAALDAIKEKV